jgi:hypothetical protein
MGRHVKSWVLYSRDILMSTCHSRLCYWIAYKKWIILQCILCFGVQNHENYFVSEILCSGMRFLNFKKSFQTLETAKNLRWAFCRSQTFHIFWFLVKKKNLLTRCKRHNFERFIISDLKSLKKIKHYCIILKETCQLCNFVDQCYF